MDDFDLILNEIDNKTVFESFVKAKSIVSEHNNISCSVSGGADSDVMLDIMSKVDTEGKCKYVWFDTGLEYQATKDHIKHLEDKYGITIERCKPKKPIPIAVRDYGVPFLSKYASDMIQRLQRHDFKWEEKPYDELVNQYPKCKGALKWWCNCWDKGSKFNVSYNKYLKEFMIQNSPQFKISNKCCQYAKKIPSIEYNKENNTDLTCIGIRQAEGGIRSTAYKSCFSSHEDKHDDYRPLFWYTNDDKLYYENHFQVKHSECYSKYGLKRTGCVGCCYNKDFENELEIIQKYEPKLYKACINIFGESYEYTKKYREFQKMMKEKEKSHG